ncbi:MAG: ABC transporter substrate-binding protein, partial [Methylobacteriaceae bacterium]|nr:ABC transporter substrate-binding protein [Methylobacteriaceae bacterium]
TRRPLFSDIRLREALGLMFDFEWINANLFGGLYTRSKSFFDESELASTGRPASARERELLAPFPEAARADIMAGEWRPAATDGSGRDRGPARRALALLKDAGWGLVDGVMTSRRSGEALAFEIMVVTRAQERLALSFAESLKRIGVFARVRVVDEVQYQRRRQKFEFDVMPGTWVATPSPGNEQRARWGSASADQEGAFNLAGARSPAIDAMISAMLAAESREDFVAAVRALDRVLLSGFYIVPFFHTSDQWLATAAGIARPARTPLFGVTMDAAWRTSP